MSTQSINSVDLNFLRSKVDSILECMSNSIINNDSFGIKFSINSVDYYKIILIKRYLNDRVCKEGIDPCVLEDINILLLKYK